MTKEHHVYGPPGTGKTRYLSEQVERAVSKWGVNHVMVSSFTKAAAHEIATRSVRLARENSGTLHSIAWRAMGKPTIAETEAASFNRTNPWQISAHRPELDERDDQGPSLTRGDFLLERYSLMRNRMESIDEGFPELRNFARAWESWKEGNGFLDFCDLIEEAKRLNLPPGEPKVAFVDEAQDLSALEFSLVRHWATNMEQVVFVGDDDQSIYDWAGADVSNLIDAPADSTIVLKKSYRLPRAVHRVANEFIQKCKRRQPKEFLCRDEEGFAGQLGFNAETEALVDLIKDELSDGRKVMLLASCSYMLKVPLGMLRRAGVPWHNQYRVTNGLWNPIRIGPKSTAHKLWCFLQGRMLDGEGPFWTGGQIERWMELVGPGVFRPGGRKMLKAIAEQRPAEWLGPVDWRAAFLSDPFHFWSGQLRPKLAWIWNNHATKYSRMIDFTSKVTLTRGVEGLISVPTLTVGTIHSVKGAEADTVILLPDISAKAEDGGDPLLRTFYVGMTRARERLYLLRPRDTHLKCPFLGKMLPQL